MKLTPAQHRELALQLDLWRDLIARLEAIAARAQAALRPTVH